MSGARFEIVHKPQVAAVIEGDRVTASEPNPQPWFARFVASNGEEVWRTSESYVDVRDVERAIALLKETVAVVQVEEPAS